MQIYVVKQGDTLTQIARTFGVTTELLQTSNQIPNPNSLVPGQTIVIPIWGSYYIVEPGDTLYSISYKFQIPISELQRINGIQTPQSLAAGTRLYIPQKPRKAIYTGGYIDTDVTGNRSQDVVSETDNKLSTVLLFSYQMDHNGELKAPRQEEQTISAIKDTDAIPIMVITNIEDGRFSQEAATAVLNNPALQDKVINQAVQIIEEKGYKGLDVDFEYIGGGNRLGYNEFLRKAKLALNPKGYTLSTAVAPKINDTQVGILYEGHDYPAHGETVNFIHIMTYEWGWVGGPPRAVAPINEVEKVMNYAVQRIPKNKIMMGIPLYGYDWTLPFVEGQSRARTISPQEAIAIADREGVSIEYDEVSQSPYFRYTDDEGRNHEVWFEDARSIQAKFDLVKKLDIRGLYYWVLGRDFPQNWLLLEDNFIIRLM